MPLNLNFSFDGIKKLRDWWPIVKSNFQQVQDILNPHIAGTADKHAAEHITYTGNAPGTNVKEGIDNLKTRVDEIITTPVDGAAAAQEIVDARGGQATLGTRLNGVDAQLAETANINVKSFGAKGDWNGTTGTDDSDAIQAALNAAPGNDEVVFPKGKYYVSKTITFKANAKIRFDGAEIITNASFVGDKVFCCNSTVGDGASHGYILNPKFSSADQRTNATALYFDYCQNFRIYNLTTFGYIKGGLVVTAGYELMLIGFEVLAPTDYPTRSFPSLQPGIHIQTSDCEISMGAVVAYPVGIRAHANNSISHVHCWGIPSTGATEDTRICLYPFVADEKGNNFVNCFADSMDILDITGTAGGTNGGIGFFDANTLAISTAGPTNNSYVNCRVLKASTTTSGKVIGFAYGDASVNWIGAYTKIIAPTFLGTGYAEYIKCYNTAVNKFSLILNEEQQAFTTPTIVSSRVTNLVGGYKQYGDRVFVHLKFTSAITGNGTIPLSSFPSNPSATISHGALNIQCLTDSTNGFANIAATNGNMNANLINGNVYVISGWYSIV